jgi:membrane protein insertase Oxa1/YidC/SpoIIIJ
MGVLRAIGYFIAIVIIIVGIIFFPIGIVAIIGGIIMIWALRKGGQVSNMQKDLKAIKKIEEENQRLKLEQMKKDALEKREDMENKDK